MHDLTGFQRDLLHVVAGNDNPYGLAVKEELETYYETDSTTGGCTRTSTRSSRKASSRRANTMGGRTTMRLLDAGGVRLMLVSDGNNSIGTPKTDTT